MKKTTIVACAAIVGVLAVCAAECGEDSHRTPVEETTMNDQRYERSGYTTIDRAPVRRYRQIEPAPSEKIEEDFEEGYDVSSPSFEDYIETALAEYGLRYDPGTVVDYARSN